jgi:hypothetical protein
MAKYTITALDTIGIQRYIFGSNRLQENIGASELVRLATEEWALEELPKPNNVDNAKQGTLKKDDLRIEDADSRLAAEVIYKGGGNAVIIFRSADDALAYAQRLTHKVLKGAPGLILVAAHHHEFDWQQDVLKDAVLNLLGDRMAASKASRLPSSPLLGLGVTAACQSTGAVAIRTDEGLRWAGERGEEPRLISREVEKKLGARDWATDRLKGLFRKVLRGAYDFPLDMDDLGRIEGEESYVAVVHADGNGMGDHIKRLAGQFPTPIHNRAYVKTMRDFSRSVEEAALSALGHVVKLLTQSLKRDEQSGQWKAAGKIPITGARLPFRPLVFGGDDVTFVCNAQIGMSLAAAYLGAFEREAQRLNLPNLHASAGIAMVKMHYPFARAYKLSEELAKSAKRFVIEKSKGRNDYDASALDWHFATSGLSGTLDQIRDREFNLQDKRTLLMRPLLLRPEDRDSDGRAWFKRIEMLAVIFQSDQKDSDWGRKRNKVKALREALRDGPKAVEAFRRNYELDELPEILPEKKTYRRDGYDDNKTRCGYFDAIELSDHYCRLDELEAEQ